MICGYCATKGHEKSACPSKEAPPKCATCSALRREAAHATGSAGCPAYQRAVDREIATTNYGGA